MAIYFVQNGNGNIKIGYAINPDKRIKSLQTANDEPLLLLGIKNGNMAFEKYLHERFKDSKVFGEWYLSTPDLLDYIRSDEDSVIDTKSDITNENLLYELLSRVEALERQVKIDGKKKAIDIKKHIMKGIETSLNQCKGPTISAIINRKPKLKKLSDFVLKQNIDEMIAENQIEIRTRYSKIMYYPKDYRKIKL